MKKFMYFLSILLFVPVIFLAGCFDNVEKIQDDMKSQSLSLSSHYMTELDKTLETHIAEVEPIIATRMEKVRGAVNELNLLIAQYLSYDIAIKSFETAGFGWNIEKKNDIYTLTQQGTTIDVEKNDNVIYCKKSTGERLFISFSNDEKSFNCTKYNELDEQINADCLQIENGYAFQISIPSGGGAYDVFEVIVKYREQNITSYGFSIKSGSALPASIYNGAIDNNFAKDYKSEV